MRTFNIAILFALVSFFSIFTSNNAIAVAPQFASIDVNANYFIIPVYNNKALDITGGSTENGVKLIQWDKHNGKNQQFRLESKGSGYYMIVNVNSGKALDVPGASYNDGVQLVQWDKHGGENQQFGFEKVGTDTYIIMNRRSRKVLDVYGGSQANGGKITQYTKHGRENQQFKLVKVVTNPTTRRKLADRRFQTRTPISKPASSVVNGYSVNYINFGQNGNKLGVFEQIGGKKWREVGSKKGSSTFNFIERQRDEWSVYLFDQSRNVNIQLDLHTKKVMYSVGNGQRRPIYEVTNPSSKMNGWLASEVTYSNSKGTKLGTFVEKGNKAWQEVSLKNGTFNFTETHRDQWSVYLHDKSRNVFIQLDLHTK
ncbi:MAG: RICIN domain-containing protein, partial [Chitinophagales bacterium]